MKLTHDSIERNLALLVVLTVLVVSVGGLLEIVPLFFQKSTTTPVEGLKPYSPLRLTGRDIYIREGCFLCHVITSYSIHYTKLYEIAGVMSPS